MSKLAIAALIAGTAAITGYVVSRSMKNKKRPDPDLFDDCDDDCCCECGDSLDVIIPAEDDENCAEELSETAEEAAAEAESAEEKADDEAKDAE